MSRSAPATDPISARRASAGRTLVSLPAPSAAQTSEIYQLVMTRVTGDVTGKRRPQQETGRAESTPAR